MLHLLSIKDKPDSPLESTIFKSMLNPDLAKNQYTPEFHDLVAEGILMVGAGTDTTASTLVIGTWFVLNDPVILRKLKAELWEAMPGKEDVDLAMLEGLPYLVGSSLCLYRRCC